MTTAAHFVCQTEHRPYPMASRCWVMHMRWHDLLFAHWPVPVESLRPLVPRELEIDVYGGAGWIGVVPFRMDNVRLRGLPPFPGTGAFSEINVRTYVTDGRRAGVWFLTLDAPGRLANAIARVWFKLNYRDARVRCDREGQRVRYESHRRDGQADFVASYRPVGAAFHARPGTFEQWLCERYCLYAGGFGRPIRRAEIHHAPWSLQRADVQIEANTMTAPLGVQLPNEHPHALFAQRMDTVVWWPRRI